ncbi:MAG: helix-turn-helix transcriptional regulator [Xanthobacteraceae bacterium]
MVKKEQLRAARALLGWSQTVLAQRAKMSLPTVKRAETGRGAKVSPDAYQALQAAMEAAGIEFTNGDAPGVRLKSGKRSKAK